MNHTVFFIFNCDGCCLVYLYDKCTWFCCKRWHAFESCFRDLWGLRSISCFLYSYSSIDTRSRRNKCMVAVLGILVERDENTHVMCVYFFPIVWFNFFFFFFTFLRANAEICSLCNLLTYFVFNFLFYPLYFVKNKGIVFQHDGCS